MKIRNQHPSIKALLVESIECRTYSRLIFILLYYINIHFNFKVNNPSFWFLIFYSNISTLFCLERLRKKFEEQTHTHTHKHTLLTFCWRVQSKSFDGKILNFVLFLFIIGSTLTKTIPLCVFWVFWDDDYENGD